MHLSRLLPLCLLAITAACSSAGGTRSEGADDGNGAGGFVGSAGAGGSAGGGVTAGSAGASGGFVGGGSGGGTGTGGGCGGTILEGKRLAASLLFVIDYSWSMCQDPSKTGVDCANPASLSKWSALVSAFGASVDALPNDTNVGLVYYPDNATGTAASDLCRVRTTPHVPLALLSQPGQRDALKKLPPQLLDSSPVNQTPTAEAAASMVSFLAGQSDADVPGVRFLVLITDGKATCGNTAQALSQALSKGVASPIPVRTFVVGVPGSQGFRSELSAAAVAGGTAPQGCSPQGPNYCHFDTTAYTDPKELAAKLGETLEAIRGKAAVTCDYKMPDPTQVGFVNVAWQDGGGPANSVLYDANCAAQGWHYDDPTKPTRIVLCPATCDAVNAGANPKLSIEIGCPTVEVK